LSLGHGYLFGDALSRVAAARSVVFGDALSRVAAARYVVFSREPHVAAIGFVFPPLPALAQLPLVSLSSWWPGISRWALSSTAVSAVFMAAANTHIYAAAAERGLAPRRALIIVALFAVNPMIVFYGANGMSEAPFLCLVCWAARRLCRWLYTDDVHDLLAIGCALALAYLVRYDAIAAAAGVAVFVAAITYRRARRGGRPARPAATMDFVLVAGPAALAFLGWAATSWLLTGQAFQQFSSAYGNTAILAQSGATAAGLNVGLRFAATEITVLAPAALILLPATLLLGWRRRESIALAALAVFGPILAFQTWSYITGSTFGFLRFYIAAIPLQVLLLIAIHPQTVAPPAPRPGRYARTAEQTTQAGLTATLMTAAVAAGLALTSVAMTRPSIAPQEHALTALVAPDVADASPTAVDRRHIIASFATERAIARYLDAKQLPAGSILLDTVYGFAVTAASDRPEVFVVPSDEDFVTILNHPDAHKVRYILTVPPTGRGASDAVNRRYPTIYDNGAEISTLEIEIPNDGANQPPWRLYRVIPGS
jgi:hypothetical protein